MKLKVSILKRNIYSSSSQKINHSLIFPIHRFPAIHHASTSLSLSFQKTIPLLHSIFTLQPLQTSSSASPSMSSSSSLKPKGRLIHCRADEVQQSGEVQQPVRKVASKIYQTWMSWNLAKLRPTNDMQTTQPCAAKLALKRLRGL